MTKEQFIVLLEKYLRQQLSATEIDVFLDAAGNPAFESLITDKLFQELQDIKSGAHAGMEREKKVWDLINSHISHEDQVQRPQPLTADLQPVETTFIHHVPVHRVHFLRKWGWAAAAVLVFAVGITTAIVISTNRHAEPDPVSAKVESIIQPGYNRAVLTLSNGQKVELDSAASGTIKDGTLSIENNEGQLIYRSAGIAAAMNTMTTPRGGQYQLTLSDGTRVWLNAASSITYPTAFTEKNRQVTITGEAYLEVAKDRSKPFLVDIAGQSTVQVLGTSFNINSYEDDGAIKTTLLEGSIKINAATILKPGQQAIIRSDKEPLLVQQVDAGKTIAWKNGMFDFNDADIRSVMHQLERWYDITVKYEPGAPNPIFKGRMYRSADVGEVLKMLKKMGVRLQLEGKVLTINK